MIALPDGAVADARPRFIDRGGLLRPFLNGDDQRLDRLGSKWGADFVTRAMKGEEARIWIARLTRGVREKVSIKFPQPGVAIQWTGDGSIQAAVAANAETIIIKRPSGTDAGKLIKEGQFFSVIEGGRRYLYQSTADVALANVGGTYQASVPVQPPVRRSLSLNSVVEILTPRMEGFVKNDSWKWSIDSAKIYGLEFSIDEQR